MPSRLSLLACLTSLLLAGPAFAAPDEGTSPQAATPASGPVEPLAGYDRFDVVAAHRAVLVPGSVWYPASARTQKRNIMMMGRSMRHTALRRYRR